VTPGLEDLAIDALLADGASDAECNHAYTRKVLAIRSTVIPPNRRNSGRRWPGTRYRRQRVMRFRERPRGSWSVVTLRELSELGVGVVSLTEALDLTTTTGRAMADMLAVFAEFEREVLRERVRAGIAQARREGRSHGRPRTALLRAAEVVRLKAERVSHSEIARRLGIGRTSVRRILAAG
jgi:DNA invertase Pin-like site-specific DNA recombinase